MKRKTHDKKAEGLKNVAISDLKKELAKCNQLKKELLEDFDKILNEKYDLENSVQELQSQIKTQN